MKQTTRVMVILVALATTAIAGDKRTGETCVEDNECSRGHCHTKKDGAKVCVDCSASDINDYRGQIERYCRASRGAAIASRARWRYTSLPKLSLGEEGTWTRPQDNMPLGQQHGEVRGHAHQAATKSCRPRRDEFMDVAKEQMKAVWFEAPKHYRHVLTDGAPRLEPM